MWIGGRRMLKFEVVVPKQYFGGRKSICDCIRTRFILKSYFVQFWSEFKTMYIVKASNIIVIGTFSNWGRSHGMFSSFWVMYLCSKGDHLDTNFNHDRGHAAIFSVKQSHCHNDHASFPRFLHFHCAFFSIVSYETKK